MENLIKPYEISLWRDVLTFVYADGVESEDVVINGHGEVVAQYYKEQKVCTIGGNNFNSPNRAVNPKLISKINGENVLTFDMYISYYDNETGEIVYNPYVNKLVNEAKVKLRCNNLKEIKWYDFLIKDIKEQSDKKIISYTAKDLFICELSKSGTNLTFDDELENSIGTVHELGERVLEGSDWKIGDERAVLQEIVEEPVYLCQLKSQISGKRIDKNTEETVQIAAGQYVYALYTDITEKRKTIQIIYSKDHSYGNYPKNDKSVIVDCKTYEVTFTENYNEETGMPGIFSAMNLSDSYRGQRFIKSPTTVYDAKIHKYVKVYTKNGEKRYGFVETEYVSPVSTQSYITNANNFVSTLGWKVNSDHELTAVTVPDIRDAERKTDGELNITNYCLKTDSPMIYNSGIIDYRSQINNFSKNDKYVFRIKIGYKKTPGASGEASELVYAPTSGYETAKGINFYITTYTINDSGEYIIDSEDGDYYLHIWADKRDGDYYYGSGSFSKSLSYSEMIKMTSSLGAFVGNPYQANLDNTIYIEDMQFFPYVQKNGGLGFYLPGEDFQAKAIDYYCYYNPASDYTNSDTLKLEYRGETDSSSYVLQYNGNSKFEKKRSLKATESNRFNLIQNLCEIFESWVKFEIKHDKDGRILLGKDLGKDDADERYRQQKYVSFHDYVKKKNYAGFKYGVNLKNISRTIESEAIISKLVVKNNSNEFATDGSCSIARSSENPSGENFLLDFSYYVQSGLIKQSTITNDLYLDNNQYLGYYKKLKDINKERDKCIQLLSSAAREIDTYTAEVEFLSADTSAVKLNEALSDFKDYTGKNYNELIKLKDDPKWKDKKTRELASSIEFFKQQKKKVDDDLSKARDNLFAAEGRYARNDRILNSKEPSNIERRLTLERNKLNKAFYQKYSRFIQEGNWNSEDYVDDSLYFFDALSTLHTSSQPKVTYQIDAVEISQIEGYENYVFNLGDETTIEDPEFFGWVFDENAAKTPYREEIVITELEFSLDQPEENKIKVQNYKTAFEDLFQRIAATTQSIEFSQGDYDRAAAIIQPNGTIRADVLQNSMANNTLKLQNAKEQSITWDERGIIVASKEAPAEIVRIINGGIYLSSDGGVNWTTGITGSGINVNSIIGKHLSIDKINIFGGNGFTSFRWDKSGISAYKFDINPSTKKAENFNFGKFVRLDQYGLYGINALENFDATIQDQNGVVGEEKIWNNANFALTWKGFMLKSNHEDGGYISITSDNDFEVKDGSSKTKVKIGKLGDSSIYGIQINGADGNPVIEQDSDGNVWIQNVLNVSGKLTIDTSSDTEVNIGYLDNKKLNTDIHEIINANDKFIVYEDGSVKATDGYFEGEIKATSGSFTGEIKATSGEFSGQIDIGDKVSIGLLDGSRTVEITQEGETDIKEVTYKQVINANNKFIVYEDGYIEAVNGHFEGEINVTSGYFSGTLAATTGQIGGFFITNNQLSSLNGAIILDSEAETIYAKNITLGEGAVIEKNIILGSEEAGAKIWNPEKRTDSTFIEAGKLTVKTTGFLNLGNIEAYGGNDDPDKFSEAYIRAINDKWEIRGDGRAIFKDIHADNVHLQNTILEINTVQAMGSLMLFKDAWTAILITEDEYNVNFNQREDASLIKLLEETAEEYEYLKIKERTNLANGDWVYIGEEVYKIEEVFTVAAQESVFTFLKIIGKFPSKENITNESTYLMGEDVIDEEVSNKGEEYIISKFGKPNEDYIFSALGSNQDVIVYDTKFATSNSLTIASFEENENGTGLEYSKKLVLGDLSQVQTASKINLAGFGLYSDNVFLRGSLVTEGSGKFAGVNTNSNVIVQDKEKDYGNIVFWAGAESYSNSSIIASPFYVTDMGLLYANQAIFEESVFTNGIIEGAIIKTAKLMGRGDTLKIYDGSPGISFIKEEESNETDEEELFRITTEGFIKETNTKDVDFVSIQKKAVGFKAFSSDDYGMEYLETIPNSKGLGSANFELKHYREENDKVANYGKIAFRISGLFLGYDDTSSMMYLKKDSINFGSDSHFYKKVFLGNNVEYRPVEQGYELYIIEEN